MALTQAQNILNRSAKINGYVEEVYERVEADRFCIDVITQIVTMRSPLN